MKSRMLLIAINCLFFMHAAYAVEKMTSVIDEEEIIGKSDNNDKYWYGQYGQFMLDGNGKPIIDSYKDIYPENGCAYEIRFSYLDDTSSSLSVPVRIYLNEIETKTENNTNKIIKSELIGFIIEGVKSSVKFSSDGVCIFTTDGQIVVRPDGFIILYANETVRAFKPASQVHSEIYNVRYEVLVDKLQKILTDN